MIVKPHVPYSAAECGSIFSIGDANCAFSSHFLDSYSPAGAGELPAIRGTP